MANRKPIPHINVPIMQANGSMELAWYLFLQWVSENAGTTDLSDYFTKEETQALLDAKANIDDLADVAFSGSYNDLSNKPTIGNATITINQGGTQKGTFTVNQSGDTIINLDAGSDIDNLTITKNNDDELQAVGVVNKNTETGATNPIYDWVGTEAEYEAQNIATLHPEWLCFITDDCENTESLIIRREVAERNMGELVYSTIPVTDAGLHLADGELLDGTGIYADFYNYMVGIQSTAPQIFCSESDWQTSVSTYGVCGKFVLDTANHTIRLPKVTGFVEGTITASELGALVEAGLPNITAGLSMGDRGANISGTGAAQAHSFTSSKFTSQASTASTHDGWDIDASRSSAVYGNSNTVQPQSVKGYVYVVIANTAKTPIQVDIDNIATELNACYGHRVVEFQAPTVANNYTWYRKYADGWVEQGGLYIDDSGSGSTEYNVVFPIIMANNTYITSCFTDEINYDSTSPNYPLFCSGLTTTGMTLKAAWRRANYRYHWEVKGMAA